MIDVSIVHSSDPLGNRIGGIQSFIRGFIGFAPDDFAISYVGITAEPDAHPPLRWTDAEVDGRQFRYLPLAAVDDIQRRRRVPLAITFAARLARHRRRVLAAADVLQVHRPGLALPLLGGGRPIVQLVHLAPGPFTGSIETEIRWRHVPWLFRAVEARIIPRVDRVFAVNREALAELQRRYPDRADRFSFLPNWVDEERFRPPSDDERRRLRAELRDLLQLGDEETRILLFVGRLEAQKDPVLLVRGVAAAAQQDPRLRLLVVGDGSLRRAAEGAAAASGVASATRFLGFRPQEEIAELLRAADLLLLPSVAEGMPITVLEALASGLPVIASRVGEIPLLVRHGEAGLLLDERTPAELAASIARGLAAADEMRARAPRAADPYRARAVLTPFYEAHRVLAARRSARA